MHEISLVVFWLHDLKEVEKPPLCGAGQKPLQAPETIWPQCGPFWSLQEGAGEIRIHCLCYSSGDL